MNEQVALPVTGTDGFDEAAAAKLQQANLAVGVSPLIQELRLIAGENSVQECFQPK